MRKIFKAIGGAAAAALVLFAAAPQARAIDIKDILGKAGAGETVANLVEGVLSTSDIEVKDMAGIWKSDGSAVCFKSDNFLQKAGGAAAAAALETKLNPYFEKLGLNGSEITIETDGTFTMTLKRIKLTGTIEKKGKGEFNFTFKALGKVKIGTLTGYAQKSVNHLDLMFDATKLKTFVSSIAKITGINIAKTVAGLLDSYDGLCVGFSMQKTGKSESEIAAEKEAKEQAASSPVGSVLGKILGGGKNSSAEDSKTVQTPASSETVKESGSEKSTEKSTGEKVGSALINILKGSGK